ncbi:MAG: hypothetical protein J3Q66DRAFT_359871 [Benniella sp.]|nr:MAG: hypothetical protein J3Q66DRAFT_359871 [Benniella sp.]
MSVLITLSIALAVNSYQRPKENLGEVVYCCVGELEVRLLVLCEPVVFYLSPVYPCKSPVSNTRVLPRSWHFSFVHPVTGLTCVDGCGVNTMTRQNAILSGNDGQFLITVTQQLTLHFHPLSTIAIWRLYNPLVQAEGIAGDTYFSVRRIRDGPVFLALSSKALAERCSCSGTLVIRSCP